MLPDRPEPESNPSHPSPNPAVAAGAFWAKVQKVPFTTCWIWTGEINERGYGVFRFRRQHLRAHRFAYETTVGAIPSGLTLDHLCRERSCVNPAHLEPVTGRANTLRGLGVTAENSRKTRCRNGHPFDEANTRYVQRTRPRLERRCRTCERGKLWTEDDQRLAEIAVARDAG